MPTHKIISVVVFIGEDDIEVVLRKAETLFDAGGKLLEGSGGGRVVEPMRRRASLVAVRIELSPKEGGVPWLEDRLAKEGYGSARPGASILRL